MKKYFLLLLSVVLFAACGNDDDIDPGKKDDPSDPDSGDSDPSEKAPLTGEKVLCGFALLSMIAALAFVLISKSKMVGVKH